MSRTSLSVVAAILATLGIASPSNAQQSTPGGTSRWSVDVGLGVEHTISGDINNGTIGTINGQTAVVLPNSYGDVYGTGFQLRFGGGYMLKDDLEARGMFTYQSIHAQLTPLGDVGVSKLYAQYDPYRSFVLDFGLRRYFGEPGHLRPYTEGSVGIGFISEIGAQFVAPNVGYNNFDSAFYHQTTAGTLAGNAGVLWHLTERVGMYAQIGVRWTSGLSSNNAPGLPNIHDGTSRWTVPIIIGARAGF